MKVLIAEDDAVSRRMLEVTLQKWGYEVLVACDGVEAWEGLQGEKAPELAILDWMMPGMDGVDVSRKVRVGSAVRPVYIILLTTRDSRGDAVTGLEAGADDYITKPFDQAELRARVQVGVRILELQRTLAHRVCELEDLLARVKRLQGLLPICSYCKKIRNDRNYWQQVESYISDRSEAEFSHGICPDCYEKYARPQLEKSRTPGETSP